MIRTKHTVCNVFLSTITGSDMHTNVLHIIVWITLHTCTMNCSCLYPLFTRPIAVTRHLYIQLNVLYMFSDSVSELPVKCHNICCQVRVLTNVINVVHRKSHSMRPPLVGGRVGLIKTDVPQNTMLIG